MEASAFDAIELTQSYVHADRYATDPRGAMFAYLTSPAVGDELLTVAGTVCPDVVVIDAMFGAALAVAPRFGVPTAIVLHSFLNRTLDGWLAMVDRQHEARVSRGFPPLPGIGELFGGPDLFQVNALASLDGPPRAPWPNVRHGAPVLEADDDAAPPPLPWADDDPTPLVLVSFSTDDIQASVAKLQRSLDALADLPVHVVTTTGPVDPAALDVPGNAHVMRFAAHGPLLRRAALVVNHGGFGTVMRALRHCVPMLCITGRTDDQRVIAFDQPPIAALVEEAGVGLAVPPDASAWQIRAAARDLLDRPGYRARAAGVGRVIRESDGAGIAAQRMAALAGGVSR